MANRYFIGDKRDELLDVQGVANLVHVSTNTIRRLSDDGKINAIRINPRGDRRYRRQDIVLFLNNYDPRKQSKT